MTTSAERDLDRLDQRIERLQTALDDAVRKQRTAAARIVALKKRITEVANLILSPLDNAEEP